MKIVYQNSILRQVIVFYFSFFTLVGVRGFVYGFIYWLCAVIINIVIFFRKRWQKNIVVPTSVHIYQMDQDIMFDADLRKLIFGKEEIQIPPQTAILLKHFLEAPDYIFLNQLTTTKSVKLIL